MFRPFAASTGLMVFSSLFLRLTSAGESLPLFPQEGIPQGWSTRDWADVSKPAEGQPVWTVRNGILTSAGDRGCWFLSDKEYGDFTLEYEFRLGPRGNSGLALRAPGIGDPAFDGMELQMADLRYNPDAKPSELTGGLYRALAPDKQVYQPEQWNQMKVSLKGTKFKAELNGTMIHDADLSTQTEPVVRHNGTPAPALKDRPHRGRIGFQNLSREGGQVEIRRARLEVQEATGQAASTNPPEEGFTPLFNGKDLSGWVNVNCAPETWQVKDGMLHCDGIPTGALRTERQYENFILEMEWRHLKPAGNAGVFIWAGPLSAPGQPFLRSIEVQVLDHAYGKSDWFTTHGDVFPIHGSSMKPFGRHNGQRSFPSEERSHGSPEWNHYRITCQDGTLRLAVNGKEVSGGEDCTWRKGFIALESEGGQVDWRNIRIKELPGGKATPEQTAPLWDGSVSLYDGRSLRGWSPGQGAGEIWRAEDWELTTKGQDAVLTLERKPGDFRMIFDVRTENKDSTAPLPLCVNGQPVPGQASGTWTRFVVTRQGDVVECRPESSPPGAQKQMTVAAGPVEISLKSTLPLRMAGLYMKP